MYLCLDVHVESRPSEHGPRPGDLEPDVAAPGRRPAGGPGDHHVTDSQAGPEEKPR